MNNIDMHLNVQAIVRGFVNYFAMLSCFP